MTRHYFQADKLQPHQENRLKAVFQEVPGLSPTGERGRDARGRKSKTSVLECGRAVGDFGRFTPAVVEQVASEHESVDDFISALEARIPSYASYKSLPLK